MTFKVVLISSLWIKTVTKISTQLSILQETNIIPIIPAYSTNLTRKDPIPRKRKHSLNTTIQHSTHKLTRQSLNTIIKDSTYRSAINSVTTIQNHLASHKLTSSNVHKYQSLVTSFQAAIKILKLNITWKNANKNIKQHKEYKAESPFHPHIVRKGLRIPNCFLIRIDWKITSLPLKSLLNSKPSKSRQETKSIKLKTNISHSTPEWGTTKSIKQLANNRKIPGPKIRKIWIVTQNNQINSLRLTFRSYWKTLLSKTLRFMKRSQESPNLTNK